MIDRWLGSVAMAARGTDARRFAVIVALTGLIATAAVLRLLFPAGGEEWDEVASLPECKEGLVSVVWRGDGEKVGCLDDLDELLMLAAGESGCRPAAALPEARAGDRVSVLPGDGRGCVLEVAPLPGAERLALGIPIDLNTASESDLQALTGIGPVLAGAIVEDREHRGPFEDVAELERVRGIGPVRLRRIAPFVMVSARGDGDEGERQAAEDEGKSMGGQ